MGHNEVAMYRIKHRVAQHQLVLDSMETYLKQYQTIHQDIISAALDNSDAHELYIIPKTDKLQIHVHTPVRSKLKLHYPKSWACMADLLELELLPQLKAVLPLVQLEFVFDVDDDNLQLQGKETTN